MTIDPQQFTRARQWKSEDILFCIAGEPHCDRRFVGSSDFRVYEYSAAGETGETAERVGFEGDGHQSYVTGLALVGETLISGSYDRRLIWWDINARTSVRTVNAHDRWIRRVISLPDGKRIASIADDMLCKVWDVATGELIAAFTEHRPQTPHHYPSMLYALCVSGDGRWLATGDKVGHVAIWDAHSYEKAGQVDAPIMYTWDPKQRRHSFGGIRGLAFSQDGTRLAVGGIGTVENVDGLLGPARLEVFVWQSGTRLLEIEDKEKNGLIEQIAWGPNDQWLLTAGGDHKGVFALYAPDTGTQLLRGETDGHIHGFLFDEARGVIDAAGHHELTRWTMTPAETSV
jgi:WD40 repeat protein